MRRWLELTSLYDLDHRFRLMDGFAGYRQLPTPSMPPIEDLADGPSFIRRISSTASARTPPADADLLPGRMQKPAEDYFKMFFADTALSGAIGATRCGLDYFGAGKVVFASDFPFDAEGGSYLVRETIKALDALD